MQPKTRPSILLVCALIILSSATCLAKTVYVKTTGLDTNDGLTWASAKKTVAAGIAASASGDEIWVAAGTYIERITLKAGAGLYGGFAGTETILSQRNWTTNRTTLDGNQAGSVVTAPSGATSTTRLDGLVIRNGKGSSYGGGIYCSSSSPTITNNTITQNSAFIGGGIYCSNSSPTITNNTITQNSADYGGGIYCYYSSPTITGNTITQNSADYGGGIRCYYSSSQISNNIVAFNSSGIYKSGTGTPVPRNNCVYGNAAYDYSGLTAGTGDISADPLFASREYGNCHIQPSSPCRDAGWNDAPGLPGTDMDGQARVQGGTVDIGADESDGSVWPPATPVIVRVSTSGNNANDGSSWALAKKTVQAGTDAASAAGGEVWVAAGTYNERITLRPYAYLYGGFAGTEVTRDQRASSGNLAILDGGGSGSVVTATASQQINGIDRFTIRNGSASNGGGIYCSNASPIITNNAIAGNSASSGGGIYCTNSSSPIITNNTITGNSASSGGGIYCTNSSSPIITNNAIAGNSASLSGGGGIYCGSSSSPTITNNTINGNSTSSTSDGGGIFCIDSSSPTITNNTINGNSTSSTSDGGGIYCYRSSPTITNNTIADNGALGGGGGGIYSSSSSPQISNNIVVFNASGVYSSGTGTPVPWNNCVYGNAAYDYSGLTAGTGDISADPLFASREYGDYHIQPGSPCPNAGWNSAPGLPATDMDGQARVQDGTVDIGADESDGTVWSVVPVIVRVSPSGNDANDGSSWALAQKTVQAGTNAASAAGGEVWVAAGTYNERITLRPYAYLYGGFAGTEMTKDQRAPNGNLTILDGGGSGSVVTATAGHKISGIDRFTIRNGSASSGGGIYCSYASPIITNNTITGNSVSGWGAGIYCSYASPTITNNTIKGNSASGWGGGIYCGSSSSPTIANNTITGNSGVCDGGGISCSYSSPTITNNTITGNNSPSIGGGICCYYSSPQISNNIFAFNSSGIWRSGTGTPVLRNNCVFGNTAYNYSGLTAGTGDISVDPLFVDRAGGDLHLRITSPCIGSWDNRYVTAGAVDMDGEPRILPAGGTVDIGADEYGAHPMWLAGEAKGLVANGQEAYIMWRGGLVVTAKFADLGAFYVESADRTTGLQCRAATLLDVGQCGVIHGTMATIDGERVLSGATAVPESLATATVPKPLFLPGRSLGGGDYFLGSDHGQQGVWGPEGANRTGLNNMGLLVSAVGRVTYADVGYFYLDDGSALDDGSGHIGVKVLGTVPVAESEDPVGKYVKVTGISSCFPVGADLFRLLRATDVRIVQ